MTRFDRRALFATGAAATLLAATGVSLAGAPRPGGHLRIAVPRVPDGLVREARSALFETLTELTPDGLLRGRLATSWKSDESARTWDLSLRQGVAFHDGSPLTSEDVAVSLEVAPIGLPGLSEIAEIDDLSLRLTLAEPDPHLPIRLAATNCEIRPASDYSRSGLIGTGHYAARFETPGGGLTAVRVGDHYLKSEAGWADRIDIVAMSDPATRSEALRSGLVDVVLSPDQSERFRSGQRRFVGTDGEIMLVADRVGCPGTTVAGDTRIAERFWLI